MSQVLRQCQARSLVQGCRDWLRLVLVCSASTADGVIGLPLEVSKKLPMASGPWVLSRAGEIKNDKEAERAMEAPKCIVCGTKHWSRQPCPAAKVDARKLAETVTKPQAASPRHASDFLDDGR